MIIFLAFIRTVSISLLCFLASMVIYRLIIWGCSVMAVELTPASKGWIGVVCLVSAWAAYRLFFRQVWHKEGDKWIQE